MFADDTAGFNIVYDADHEREIISMDEEEDQADAWIVRTAIVVGAGTGGRDAER